jgi:HAD superfamily hydrolase (TIGR01484 family)
MVEQDHAASKISLVLADVDGTLVTADKVLTPRARAAVKALHAAGIAFAITSGRPPRGMAMLIDPLALRTPIAGFNGGIFVKPDMTIMEEHVLAADVAQRALEVILRNGMDVWVYSGKDWLVRDRNVVEQVLHLCDVVLVMTVNPGFSGQKFLPEMPPKIRGLRRLCASKGLNPWIEVDGGQNGDNAAQAIEAGADAIVAGSAIFGSGDYAAAISRIRNSTIHAMAAAQ